MRPRSLLLLVPRTIPGAGEAPETYSPKLTSTSLPNARWLMTPQLSTAHIMTRHVRQVNSFLKRTGAAAERFSDPFLHVCHVAGQSSRGVTNKLQPSPNLLTILLS